MITWGRRHPWLFASCFSLAAFLICSFVPMWATQHGGGCVVCDPYFTFWEMAQEAAFGYPLPLDQFAGFYALEVMKFSAILAAGGGVGWLVLSVGGDARG